MKKIYANGSRLQSNAGRPKKWNSQNSDSVMYNFNRFGVYDKKLYKLNKKTGELVKILNDQ